MTPAEFPSHLDLIPVVMPCRVPLFLSTTAVLWVTPQHRGVESKTLLLEQEPLSGCEVLRNVWSLCTFLSHFLSLDTIHDTYNFK